MITLASLSGVTANSRAGAGFLKMSPVSSRTSFPSYLIEAQQKHDCLALSWPSSMHIIGATSESLEVLKESM